MNIVKKIISGLYFFKVSALFSVILIIFTLFLYNPMKSLSYNKGAHNILGSMVDNLNLTGRDDTSYETNYIQKVSTSDIFKYIIRYSRYLGVDEAQKLARLIKKECRKYNLNPYLVLAIIKVESGFNPAAISSQGAIGLMQMMPQTAMHIASQKGIILKNELSLHDPLINVELGIYYLNYLFKRYNDVESALFAYNYGPGRFEILSGNAKVVPAYVNKVIKFRDYLQNLSITKES